MVTLWKIFFIWRQYCSKLTNRKWPSMFSVCSYQHQYSSSQWSKSFWFMRHSWVSLQQIIIVQIINRSTDHTKTLLIWSSLVVIRRKMSIICHILGYFKILLTVIITWFVIQVWDALDIVIIITTTTLIMIIWSNKLSYLCTHADSVGKLTVGFQVLHPGKGSTFWAFWISPNQFFYTVTAKKG